MSQSEEAQDPSEALRRMVRPENQPYSREREERYKAKFPYLSMSADEYAARHGHRILCFSLHQYEYRDSRLKEWFQRLYALLCDRQQLQEVRRQYLTPAEIAEAKRVESADEF
jgi:hypothetical protein